jgi:hypothetical protein
MADQEPQASRRGIRQRFKDLKERWRKPSSRSSSRTSPKASKNSATQVVVGQAAKGQDSHSGNSPVGPTKGTRSASFIALGGADECAEASVTTIVSDSSKIGSAIFDPSISGGMSDIDAPCVTSTNLRHLLPGIVKPELPHACPPSTVSCAATSTLGVRVKDGIGVAWSFTQLFLKKAPLAVDTNPVKVVFGIAQIALELKKVGKSYFVTARFGFLM